MKKKLLTLLGKIEDTFIDVLKELSLCANSLEIDYFIIGAKARDLVFKEFELETGRATHDLNIGIQVENWDIFSALKMSMLETGHFTETQNQQCLRFKDLINLDIIPFGAISNPDNVITWPPDQSVKMSTIGYNDAYNDAFIYKLSDDNVSTVRVASIRGLTILKIISWYETYPARKKDAVDLEFMIRQYADAGNHDRFYDEMSDLINEEDFDYELASARFLGRDLKKLCHQKLRQYFYQLSKIN